MCEINVPEVLIVHKNEIYKKLTTIKWNKLKFEKIFKKNHIFFLKSKFIIAWNKKSF